VGDGDAKQRSALYAFLRDTLKGVVLRPDSI
jgi:hypothetical protein